MGWTGKNQTFNYEIQATSKELIQRAANLFRKEFNNVLPPKRLKIEETELTDSITYYSLNFNYDYGFYELFDGELESEFEEYLVVQELLPFYNVFIEMIIIRWNQNLITTDVVTDKFYICSKAK